MPLKSWNGVLAANLKSFNGVAKANLKSINGLTIPAAGSTIVFDETWGSCTPGLYQDDPITGADESNWLIDEGGADHGVEVPDPASTYVILRGDGGEIYVKNSNVGGSSTYNYISFNVKVPATNGEYVRFMLKNAAKNMNVFNIDVSNHNSISVNGGGAIDSGAGADTWFNIAVTIDYTNKTFDYVIGTASANDVAWADSVGTEADMILFEIYVRPHANNKKQLGNVYVGNGAKA